MKVDLFKLFDIIKANPEDFAVFHRDLEEKDNEWDDDDAELVMRKHGLSTEEMTSATFSALRSGKRKKIK